MNKVTSIIVIGIVIMAVLRCGSGEIEAAAGHADMADYAAFPCDEELCSTYQEWRPDQKDIESLAKTMYGECRGVMSMMEQAAVAWCVLNRVDDNRYPNTVTEVVSQRMQFAGYDIQHPILEQLQFIAEDVLTKWHLEQMGEEGVGRVLPKTYIYFVGDGTHNYFTEEYLGKDYWDFSLPNPYEN